MTLTPADFSCCKGLAHSSQIPFGNYLPAILEICILSLNFELTAHVTSMFWVCWRLQDTTLNALIAELFLSTSPHHTVSSPFCGCETITPATSSCSWTSSQPSNEPPASPQPLPVLPGSFLCTLRRQQQLFAGRLISYLPLESHTNFNTKIC